MNKWYCVQYTYAGIMLMNKNGCANQNECKNHAEANITFFNGGEPSGRPSVLSTSTLRLKPSFELGDDNSALPDWGGVAREDGTSGVPERLPMNPCRKRADSEPLVSKASA